MNIKIAEIGIQPKIEIVAAFQCMAYKYGCEEIVTGEILIAQIATRQLDQSQPSISCDHDGPRISND
jgi:hypothetical protein